MSNKQKNKIKRRKHKRHHSPNRKRYRNSRSGITVSSLKKGRNRKTKSTGSKAKNRISGASKKVKPKRRFEHEGVFDIDEHERKSYHDYKYSIEDIYRSSGQFDKVVTLIFKISSESHKKYGNHITGIFSYTPKERKDIQERISEQKDIQTHGHVRFKELLNNISDEQKKELIEKGIPCVDIHSIITLNRDVENLYIKEKTRELPEALKINVDLSDWNDSHTLGLYQQYMKTGYELCPFENDENIALILMQLKDHSPKKQIIINDFTDKNTGKLKSSIRLEYLKKKYSTTTGLSKEEKEDFDSLLKEIAEHRAEILKNELQKSTEKFKEIGLNYSENLAKLVVITSSFQPERLTHNKKPVWWDYDRFIHIYIRHVSEIQTGERFEEKTVFQYKFEDVRQLVRNVLQTIEEDIQKHFEQTPGKPFKRHGERSVYYEGDYYVIHIDPDGRLMAFYKKSK